MTKNILSLDPGTRFWGVSIFKGNEIAAAMIKVLAGGNSPRKRLEEVRKIFLSLTADYAPDVLVIEKPFPFWSRQSRFLDMVIDEIKYLARKEKIKIYEYSPRTVRKIICGNASSTKKDVAKLVCSIYPELEIHLNQDRKSRETYWGHMFDAVGLGVCYLKTKRKQNA
jgi:Holliday junction resolvasome RuvABC endonuclease subunit